MSKIVRRFSPRLLSPQAPRFVSLRPINIDCKQGCGVKHPGRVYWDSKHQREIAYANCPKTEAKIVRLVVRNQMRTAS